MARKISHGHANRGKKLEWLLDMTHTHYFHAGMGDIRKVPPPVEIISVNKRAVNGQLGKAEWVDYNGICSGRSIVFEAKESIQERWPLANITDKQYAFLKSWHSHGAVTFLVVCFWLKGKNEPEIYVLHYAQLEQFVDGAANGGSKSISLSYFREHCQRVRSEDGIAVNYLKVLNLEERSGERWLQQK